MSTSSQVDPNTLGWVKAEIDETLNQARQALEGFAEDTSDKTRLRFCITHLHQVVGTLLMVELDGAAMLAQETEDLTEAIYNAEVEDEAASLESVTRGIITIPDYLSRLQFGQPDIPLRLLPYINELRVARNEKPLPESELFYPDLSVRPVSDSSEQLEPDEFSENTKALRKPLQNALLTWLRNESDTAPLKKMEEVFEKLQKTAYSPIVEQLFWVAGGFVEALGDGGLEATNDRKRLFARIDQEIKKLIDNSGKPAVRSVFESLLKDLLLEAGRATSKGSKVKMLKQAFSLDSLLPAAEGSETDETASDLPTPEALQSVSAALTEEINSAQDILAAYFDRDREEDVSLEPLIPILTKMSSTMEMLNVDPLVQLVNELTAVCKAADEGKIDNLEDASMLMARGLLVVAQGTEEMGDSISDWKRGVDDATIMLRALHDPDAAQPGVEGFEVSDAELSDNEYRQLVGVVGEEVRVNLTQIEESLETFAADDTRLEELETINSYLGQIEGAVQILGQDELATLTGRTIEAVNGLVHGHLVSSPRTLEALAVAVGTIGAYLEGLQYDRPNLETLLEVAEYELQTLAAEAGERAQAQDRSVEAVMSRIALNLDQWINQNGDAALQQFMRADLLGIVELSESMQQEKIAQIARQMNTLLQFVTEDPAQFTDEIQTTLLQSCSKLTDLISEQLIGLDVPEISGAPSAPAARPKPVKEAPAAAAPPAPVFDDDFDEEIMEIFIEDAQDCIKSIQKFYPTWSSNPSDDDSLLELRRNFHTLKGSGRMVGVSDIAELAWSIEELLNKVRDKKIAPSPTIIEVVGRVSSIVPDMIGRLQGGPGTSEDYLALQQMAHELSEGKAVDVPGMVAVPPSEASAPAVESDIPDLDDTLLEIYTTEAIGHLKTVSDTIDDCRLSGGRPITQELVRATHTLRGSARSVGLMFTSDATGNMEKVLLGLQELGQPLSGKYLDYLDRVHSAVSLLVSHLNDRTIDASGLTGEFTNLGQELQVELETLPIPDLAGGSQPVVAPPAPAPAAPISAPAASSGESVVEDIDPELLEIFHEEAVELLQTMEESLQRWRANSNDTDAVGSLKRALHTLKGGARMSGAMVMGNLSHVTESLMMEVEAGNVSVSDVMLDMFDEAYDALVNMLDQIQSGQPVTSVDDLLARFNALISGQPVAPAVAQPAAVAPASARQTPDAAAIAAAANAQVAANRSDVANVMKQAMAAQAQVQQSTDGRDRRNEDERRDKPREDDRRTASSAQIRVRTALLNDLVNYAGEASISRARMEQQVFGFRDNLGELNRSVVRFRDQLRELEIESEVQISSTNIERASVEQDHDFDPLEFDRFTKLQQLSRGLTEGLHDLSTIHTSLSNFVGEAESVLQQQARQNTDLQEGLMRTRMVGFATQAARLRAIVRQTSREVGKRVDLEIVGADVEIDRNVLERMIGPFEHMIRNSIDHGIEDVEARKAAGKPGTGKVTLSTSQEGSEIVIRFIDDGAGLNVEAIRAKAIERGLMSDDSQMSQEEVMQFILVAGFSTAQQVTQLSGRGVGMDVVHSEVKQLGGTMSVDTEPGKGTTFTVRLPLTLSITQALMVRMGESLYAVPISMVANIIEVPVEKLKEAEMGGRSLLSFEDNVYPFVHLGEQLGLAVTTGKERKVPVLLVKAGSREVAMEVEALVGTREVVIKPLSPQISKMKGIAGATILGDGRVVLILDVSGLLIAEEAMQISHTSRSRTPTKPAADAKPVSRRPIVMVVDDSLTVRKVTSRTLQKNSIDVLTAKDGIDGLEQLRSGGQRPDVMLVDIEMPRMDGYEFTTQVRADPDLKQLPIIMITSRAGEKHRNKAFELGVNEYMSKPYQEDILLEKVRGFLPAEATF